MPFTPAHVAAVLPVLGRRAPWVVPAAWVVGSMAPDLVYFTPVGWVRPLSHSVTGLLTLDPALGVALLAAWWLLVGPAARDLLPRTWRSRLPVPAPPPRKRWVWVLVGLLAGSVTHVAWDAFTHHDGVVVIRAVALREPLLGARPGYSVLQDASGVVGLVIVAVWGMGALRRAVPLHDDGAVLSRHERTAARFGLVGIPVALCVGIVAQGTTAHLPVVSALFLGFTRSVGISAVLALLASAGWHALRRRRTAPMPSPV